ncbi:MAG: division/cell wall cluster transcriptional repressor MraZ [Actinomycetales bacterium]|nr:division/cell wall cluster transcriptional repressor MraZ [Actinomycetales bacterium]
MLLGTFAPKLDDKGRLVLPAKFWDEFSRGVVVTEGRDGCLYLYGQEEFETLYRRMSAQLDKLGQAGRDFIRRFLGGASQEVPDSQRRITIPPALREHAHLERELTVIGTGTHAEVWDTATLAAYTAQRSELSDADEEVIQGLF